MLLLLLLLLLHGRMILMLGWAATHDRHHSRQHFEHTDKRQIEGGQVYLCWYVIGREVADIETLQKSHALILPDFVGHLTVSHINAVYMCRSLLQQAVREAARRNPRIKAHKALGVDAKSSQASLQFMACTTHVLWLLSIYFNFGRQRDCRAGFFHHTPIHAHFTLQYIGLHHIPGEVWSQAHAHFVQTSPLCAPALLCSERLPTLVFRVGRKVVAGIGWLCKFPLAIVL
mmetsp:Transcript_22515/g.62204  ORF Transcript_22515/g.62204 Transcript_22515/m.62204 type:complete len:230 (+) Transcript_22515:867-1556(+)